MLPQLKTAALTVTLLYKILTTVTAVGVFAHSLANALKQRR